MRLAALAIGAALLVGATGESAEDLLQRTKTTTATYSLYSWMVQRDDEGEPDDVWAAEFNSGDWHRVEGPKVRLLANCRTHAGWIFDIDSGEATPNELVWVGACGIATYDQIISVDRAAAESGPDGPLDVIRITEKKAIRTYAIDRNGVLVRAQRSAANGSPSPCTQSEPIAVTNSVPAKDMFTVASLQRSFVPARYRVRPRDFPATGVGGRRCG